MDWLRWYHGTTADPKLGLVARRAGASRCEAVAVWAAVLEHASTGDDRGSLDRLNPELIAYALDLDDERVRSIIGQMTAAGMIVDGRVAAWDKRQPGREDPTAADRKRRQRLRERHERMQPEDGAPRSEQDEQAGCHARSRTVTRASRGGTPQSRAEQNRERHHSEPSAAAQPPARARTHAREERCAAPGDVVADFPTDAVPPMPPDAVPAMQEDPRPDAAPAEADPEAVPGRWTADADSAPDADSGTSRATSPETYRQALAAAGFDAGQIANPDAARLCREWAADAVPLPRIADAIVVATARLGEQPRSPKYLAPIVAELSRPAGDAHVRSDRGAARGVGGRRQCLVDEAAAAERAALAAIRRQRRPERDITPAAPADAP